MTPKDNNQIKKGLALEGFRILRRHLIERCYEELLELAYQQNSRIAFQVLGCLLMEYNVKLKDEIKRLILENSRWKDERHKLKDKRDRIKRKRHLFEFREKILNY